MIIVTVLVVHWCYQNVSEYLEDTDEHIIENVELRINF